MYEFQIIHSHNSLKWYHFTNFLKNLRYIKLQQDPKLIKEGGFPSVLV